VPPSPHDSTLPPSQVRCPWHAENADQAPFLHERDCVPQAPQARSAAPEQAPPTASGTDGCATGSEMDEPSLQTGFSGTLP
jgi:hypothetical protein